MNKAQSGGLLIGAGVLLNIVGLLLTPTARAGHTLVGAGLIAALMLASVVIGLFGLYRLIVGLASRPPQ